MSQSKKIIRIYDGANFCASCDKCPVVDYYPEGGWVVISDPEKPEKGSFRMNVEEYNTLIRNAKIVPKNH